jgi:hypothetical protein
VETEVREAACVSCLPAVGSAFIPYFFSHRSSGCQSDWCSRTWAEW